MDRRTWAYIAAVPLLLALVGAVALFYAHDRGISWNTAIALLPAFLLELVLYVSAGLRRVRERLEELQPAQLAALMTAAAPVSYALYTAPLGLFSAMHVLALFGLGGMAAFWYLVFRRGTGADLGFVVLLAGVYLAKIFDAIYPDVTDRVPTHILGTVMWYRTGLLSVLLLRRMDGIGFGFVPRRGEWAIGLRNFLWFVPLGLAIAAAIGFVDVRPVRWELRTLIIAVLTFVGVLWVLAVAEEFFFRGILQQIFTRALGSPTAGLILASAIFGASHLGYRVFPNWRFAIVAAIAGLFYGRAYQQAGSIRAPMVTHACVVTVWKVFLA